MLRVLAAAGADPRAPSRDGTTPLMAAAGLGYNRGGGSAFIRDRRDFVRGATADLLRALEEAGAEAGHPTAPHEHPDARRLANPVAATPASVAAGAAAYRRFCASWHGPSGRGDGPLATATAAYGARPSNLADATWQHGGSDGEIFVAIRDGVGPDFAMDAFGGRLAAPDIWNVVNFLRRIP